MGFLNRFCYCLRSTATRGLVKPESCRGRPDARLGGMMSQTFKATALLLLLGALVLPAQAQERRRGVVHVPDSSLEDHLDAGERAHTNHRQIIGSDAGQGPAGGMTPAQMRSFYKLPLTGGHGVIAI